MSITNNKKGGHFVEMVRPVVAEGVEILTGRIGQLEAKERAAVMKGDWSAARSAAIEKAKLKEIQHRTAVGSRRSRA